MNFKKLKNIDPLYLIFFEMNSTKSIVYILNIIS